MSSSQPARTRRTRSVIVAAVVVGAALIGLAVSRSDGPHGDPGLTSSGIQSVNPTTDVPPAPPGGHDEPGRRELGRPALGSSGHVPDDVTVFDDGIPAVANLDPALLAALRRAATDAAGDRVVIYVTSGWRSAEYQGQLLREAISEYGSEKEAARWVATPQKSAHVSGDAVDIGPSKAETWLSKHGAEYGLCQIYRNEPWHYELRPDAADHGCPPRYADPTQDPRMQ
jgi:D-alanyl-D-alanine carboxypeptidase